MFKWAADICFIEEERESFNVEYDKASHNVVECDYVIFDNSFGSLRFDVEQAILAMLALEETKGVSDTISYIENFMGDSIAAKLLGEFARVDAEFNTTSFIGVH